MNTDIVLLFISFSFENGSKSPNGWTFHPIKLFYQVRYRPGHIPSNGSPRDVIPLGRDVLGRQ
jgi:hypothetical protein